jgi:2-polyprenyl-3-methyl-5-hydroxy-6-metoxy-1,4-benzoquinol methylase
VYGTVDDYFAIPIDQSRIDFYTRLATNIADIQNGYGRMLDVGCGRGEFVYAARQIGWDAHGIDPDSHFPEFARRRFGLTTVRSVPLSDVVAAGETFDALSLNAVLEHIPRPTETMRQASLVVRPGGTIFIEVPHGQILRFWAADVMLRLLGNPSTTHLSPFHPPYHLYEFSRQAVSTLLSRTGFEVVRVEFWPGSNRVPANMLSARLKRILYGALVAAENMSGRTYNLHVYARRTAARA